MALPRPCTVCREPGNEVPEKSVLKENKSNQGRQRWACGQLEDHLTGVIEAILERETGIETVINSLGSCDSTTELLPLNGTDSVSLTLLQNHLQLKGHADARRRLSKFRAEGSEYSNQQSDRWCSSPYRVTGLPPGGARFGNN